tara:strand:+ start:112341 stop:113870 length:1530 start_codon:yes stop_codon:yes gene_type:complete
MLNPIKFIQKIFRYIPGYSWLESQIKVKSVLTSFLTLCALGFVPGAWFIGVPILSLYGLYHIKSITRATKSTFFSAIRFQQNFSRASGALIGDIATNRTAALIRGGVALLMLFSIPMPFCFLGLYGLFRYPASQWKTIFQQRLEKLYQFSRGLAEGVHSRTTFYKRLNIALISAPILAALIYYQGGLFVFNLALSLVQYAAIFVGFSAFFKDLGAALKQPIKSFLSYTGLIVGAFWGRFLAHTIFPGRIYGNMGPAVGHVVQTGFMSSIFSSFLMPNSWFVGFETGFAYLLTSRISSFFNGVMNSVFFSYDMQLYGDFYGTIGPTSFQIFLMIALGAFVGYKIQHGFESAGETLYDDAQKLNHAIVHQRGLLSTLKWHAAYVVGSAPLFLVSPIGASFLNLASGNILLAQSLIMAASATMITALYTVGISMQHIYSKLYPENPRSVIRVLPRAPAQANRGVIDSVLDEPKTQSVLQQFSKMGEADAIGTEPLVMDEVSTNPSTTSRSRL